eukprot:91354-Prorocentrum_lima.AAC.1
MHTNAPKLGETSIAQGPSLTLVSFALHGQKSAKRAVPVTLPGGHAARNLTEHSRWPETLKNASWLKNHTVPVRSPGQIGGHLEDVEVLIEKLGELWAACACRWAIIPKGI